MRLDGSAVDLETKAIISEGCEVELEYQTSAVFNRSKVQTERVNEQKEKIEEIPDKSFTMGLRSSKQAKTIKDPEESPKQKKKEVKTSKSQTESQKEIKNLREDLKRKRAEVDRIEIELTELAEEVSFEFNVLF
jgi:carbonic anhydrase/acetyltransferase-like protein (isoleucine patch superfamily)